MNLAAWGHARAMLHYTATGRRTPAPEQLSLPAKVKVLLTGVTFTRPSNDETPGDRQLPYETIRFGSPGLVLEAWLIRAAHSRGLVVLFHGHAQSKSSLLNEAAALYRLGYSTLLVDLRGSGGSDGNESSLGYHEADDVVASVKWARTFLPDLRPVILFGRSMGGAAVLRAVAEKGLEVNGLILESVFDNVLSAVRNRFAAMKLPSFLSAELLVFWGGIQRGFNAFRHCPMRYAADVSCPVLLLQGERDPRITPEQAHRLYMAFRGMRTRVTFPKGGHASCFHADPVMWETVVGNFLDQLDRGREPFHSLPSWLRP